MDLASKKEDKDSLLLTYLENLPPLRQSPPVKTHHDRLSSYPLLEDPDPATLFENLAENPYGSEKVGEEALLWHEEEEPKIVHQEKPACVDEEPGKLQDVEEWPCQECREARSCFQHERAASNPLGSVEIGDCELIDNPFVFMRLCEDHLLSPEEYYETVHQEKPAHVDEQVKIQQDIERPSQDCTIPQLIPKSSVNITQGENWGETWPALDVREENMMRDGDENNDYNLVEETASNSVGDIASSHDAHSPDDSISSPDLSYVRRLIVAVAALHYTAQMVKRSKDSEPITFSNAATVHDDNRRQPGSFEEVNQLMARMNMKRTMPTTYGCHCKKSECTSPRCACFTLEIKCTSSCYCRGCCLNNK